MDHRALQWILSSLSLWLAFIQLFLNVANTQHINNHDGRKLNTNHKNPGFISIDCGASADYVDETSGIAYQTDQNFIGSGANYRISPDSSFSFRQLQTVRSFSKGVKNCYTLKPEQDQNSNYLIRASFAYGNYDNKNQPPAFNLYLGVNFWAKIQLDSDHSTYYEIIQAPTDIVHVCLVNIGLGTPIISTLELRLLNNSIYSTSLSIDLQLRHDVGSGVPSINTRYKDDVYDRLWKSYDDKNWDPFKTSAKIIIGDSPYKLPPEVLSTAVQPLNASILLYTDSSYDLSYQYYLFLHFAEIELLPPGHKRIINVTFDEIVENTLLSPITLEYLKPVTLSFKYPTQGNFSFTVRAAAESDAPPILNAFDLYQFVPQPDSPTNAADVDAIMEIKSTYGLNRIKWQGDPCVPSMFAWDGLSCSSDKNPRIISLNLNSSKLKGQIATSFSNLQKLESLDLSNNELTGQIPEFLANLPTLKFLNLTRNKLIGSIPKALREKPDLQLSVTDNPGLCQTGSCKGHKFVIPLVASIAVLVIIVIVSLTIWIFRKKRRVLSPESQNGFLKQKNRTFSYFEVLRITNNFETLVGEGGFGKVYLGTLQDDTQVAVKFLSPSSRQGYKEFQSEAQLLMIIHHRNLVSLVGYCNEDNVKALIYEYMDNGDLSQQLSVKNPNVLKWNERLQIAVDAAKGLEYLHNGCRTPIIHRDLKPSNILLNKHRLAKIADFGLSRAFTNERDYHLSTQPAGTPGYIDPEFHRSGNLNKKSDIYSFGMILLELITGLPPIRRELEKISFTLDWVRPKIDCGEIQDIVDPRLAREFGAISAWRAIEIAMSCVLPTQTQRPDISYILQELKECLALEMDHVRTDRTGSSTSLNFTVRHESITTLSAR